MRTSILRKMSLLACIGRLRLLLAGLFISCVAVEAFPAGSDAKYLAPLQTSLEVSGKVSDENGESLPGVNVLVQNTTIGTVTDANGNYTLVVPDHNATLVYSFIGYAKQEVSINGRTRIDVSLARDIQALEEVVVVGYGTQSREKLIGSVAQISGEKIAERPVSQLKNALTGQLPGVTITQRSGAPGVGSGRISIRGVGSFGASPDPLILVDGVPIENFNSIDPNSVESISVLKDASSSAIYGSRAANGVILVTTKTGKVGAPKISVHSYVAMQAPTEVPDYVNSWEYQQGFYEAENGSSILTPAQLAEVDKYRAQNDPLYPNINYLDEVLSQNAMQTGHNVTVSGGTKTNNYNLSLGYLYQDGMVVRNDYSRYNVRLNMQTTFSPKLTLTTRLAAIASKINEPMAPADALSNGMESIVEHASRLPNTFVARYDNGDFGLGLAKGTPISELSSESFFRDKDLDLTGSLKLDYNVIDDLKVSFMTSYINSNRRQTTFRSTQRLNDDMTLGPNFIREEYSGREYFTVQAFADYSKQIGDHYISALAGYSFEENRANNFNGYRDNLPSNDLAVLQMGSLNNQQTTGSGSEYALESQFARVNYNYSGKYLVEGVVRRDGSSRFPTSEKYAVFPSVAVGWRISEEAFMKENLPQVSNLKVKASWGVLGNQNISNYPFQNTLVSTTGLSYSFGGQVYQGAARNTIVDSTLHWESTRTKDIGLEAGFFKNKLNVSATYFDRYTYDILYSPSSSVSNVLGFGLSQQNTGKLKNTGWEFTADYADQRGKFSWFINSNFTIINNEVLDLGVGNIQQPNGMVGNGSDLFIGYPNSGGGYGLYYGYVADGLFIDAEDIETYEETNDQTTLNPDPQPGDIRYKDMSGPDGVPDGVVDATYDRVVLGSQIPKYTYGVSLGGKYGGFDLSILLQGITGVSGRLSSYAAHAYVYNTGNMQRWQWEGRWTEENPDRNAIYPRLENISGANANTTLSSYWVQDGSYLRIKNVQLGYTFSNVSKLGISNARVYLSGENLHTFNNYIEGWDPEINGDGSFYPIMSSYTLGINVTF